MKVCTKCKVSKCPEDFYSKKSGKDGLTTACKECTKQAVRTRYYSPEGREKILAYEKRRFGASFCRTHRCMELIEAPPSFF